MADLPDNTINIQMHPPSPSSSSLQLINSPRNSPYRQRTNFLLVPGKVLEESQQIDEDPDIVEAAAYFNKDDEVSEEKSEAESEPKPAKRKGDNVYDIYFKPGVFAKFFFMHIAFYFCFGPFIYILSPIFGKHVLRNQKFIGFNTAVLRQTIEYLVVISFLLVFYKTETKGLEAMEVYMLVTIVIIRMVTISAKYAYETEYFIKLMFSKDLTPEDFAAELILANWRSQADIVIEEELQASILRLEIDSPLFFFNFLGKIDRDMKRKLTKKTGLGKLGAAIIESQKTTISETAPQSGVSKFEDMTPVHPNESMKKQNGSFTQAEANLGVFGVGAMMNLGLSKTQGKELLEKSPFVTNMTKAVIKAFSTFLKEEKLESSCLYGYSLLFDLFRKAKTVRYSNLGTLCLTLSVIRALLPTIYRAYLILHDDEDIPLFTERPYIVALIFALNVFFFWATIFIISMIVQDVRTKVFCFKQISYLICPRKGSFYQDKKLYPTLNIFDPVTLRTWCNLRRVVNEYGKRFILRNNFNVTVSMSFYFFIIAILVLQALGVFKAYNDPLLIIVFGFESIVFFVIFSIILMGAAFINDQFKVHKNLLKKNKTIIADFQRLSDHYVGKNPIEPGNIVYKEGLKMLKQELGEEDFQSKLVERAENLTGMIDDIIEELEFEEENEPFTVLGVAVNYGMIKSLAVGAASLAFGIGQSFMD